MGVTFQEFKFLEYINNSINFGNVLTIGRQELILNTKDKIRLNLLNTEFSNDKFIDNLLLKKLKIKSFINFTLWSEHLILHTKKSLKCFLEKAGFKKNRIFF